VVTPERSPRGGRLYNDADVARLRRIKRLVDRGHAIGQVAALDDGQVQAMLDRAGVTAAGPDLAALRARFIAAIESLDARTAQQMLGRAALLLGPRALVLELVVPLLQEIGDRWASGIARVAHEHAASAVVRTVVGGLLATQPSGRVPRTMVVATPAGEQHEMGALVAALLAAVAGWDVLYLGPNLPAEEILAAARTGNAAAVAISIVNQPGSAETEAAQACIAKLVDGLARSVLLLVGGAGAAELSPASRVRRFDRLGEFDRWLQSETAAAGGEEG